MKIKRGLFLAVGLLATILGLSVAVDTAFADGCCCCCCCCSSNNCPNKAFATCGTSPCYTPGQDQHLCDDSKSADNCGNGSYVWIVVTQFPMGSCSTDKYGTQCNQELTDCWTSTSCKYVNGKCVEDVQGTLWSKVSKWVTGYCPT